MLSPSSAIASLLDDNSIGLAPAELQQPRLGPIFAKGRHCGRHGTRSNCNAGRRALTAPLIVQLAPGWNRMCPGAEFDRVSL